MQNSSRPYQKKLNYDPQVNIFDNESNKDVTLERKNVINYLGLLIDENLSWMTHIHSVANKISKTNWDNCEIKTYCSHLLPPKYLSVTNYTLSNLRSYLLWQRV